MGLRPFFPPASAALALGLALATGAGACHDVGLYPLQARPADAGSEPVDVGSEPVDLGSSTDVGTSDAPVDMPVMPPCANVAVVGYATFSSMTDAGVFHAGTSGGGKQTATNTVTVTTLTDLAGAAADNSPKVIIVSGMLEFPPIPDGGTSNTPISVGSNKTIVGAANTDSGLVGGGLDLTGSSNVIVRNLKISKAYHSDAIHLQYSLDVWIDHCDLSCDTDPMLKSACDDLVGISHASDYVTISWTYYHDHHDTGIIGHSDSALAQAEDPGHLRVTLYQDRFFNVDAGPRIRFGKVHLFNVDFDTVSDYAVAATTNATVFVESSYFNGVGKPLTTMLTGSPDPGYIGEGVGAAANLYIASGTNVFTTQAMPWNSDYPPLGGETAQFVPNVVQGCVGTGKIDPLPIP